MKKELKKSEEGIAKNEEKIEEVKEEQIKNENKILRNFFIIVGVIVFGFIATWFFVNYSQHFEYKGVRFDLDKDEIKGMTLYRVSFPVALKSITGQVSSADYNFWFRNDPRELEKNVSIVGDLRFRKNMVLDLTSKELYCNGTWNLALGTITNSFTRFFGMNVTVKNKKTKYKPAEDYMFLTINKANVTEIRKLNETSYEININNCEVLPVAERFLLEAITKYNQIIS